MSLKFEQLQFFYDEVLGELGWNDDVEESGIDPLRFVKDEIKDLQNTIKVLRKHIAEKEHDCVALYGALGNPVPESFDGLLSNGTEPKNVLAEYLSAEHRVNPTLLNDDPKRVTCPNCQLHFSVY